MKKDMIVSSKLTRIAKFLNSDVKNRVENEYGYVTIHHFYRENSGCVVRVHHRLDNTLTFDLLISEAANKRYSDTCNSAFNHFKCLFNKKLQYDPEFIINNKHGKKYKRLWADITSESDELIFERLRTSKKEFTY